IVVIENIVRHMEQGMAPLPAALTGVREIGFTVVSIMLSLVAVFAAAVRQQHADHAAARVFGDADRRGGDFGDRLAHPDPGAVRPPAQARAGTAASAGPNRTGGGAFRPRPAAPVRAGAGLGH